MHLADSWWVKKLQNFILSPMNLLIPVKHETLHIDRQRRFALNWKGDLLDLSRMTDQEISDYLSDENEIERRQNPGRRHRNWSTVQCSYFYISSKWQAIESLKRIKSSDFPKVNLRFSNVRVPRKESAGCAKEINNNLFGMTYDSANNLKTESGFGRQMNDPDSLEPNPEMKLLLFIHGA